MEGLDGEDKIREVSFDCLHSTLDNRNFSYSTFKIWRAHNLQRPEERELTLLQNRQTTPCTNSPPSDPHTNPYRSRHTVVYTSPSASTSTRISSPPNKPNPLCLQSTRSNTCLSTQGYLSLESPRDPDHTRPIRYPPHSRSGPPTWSWPARAGKQADPRAARRVRRCGFTPSLPRNGHSCQQRYRREGDTSCRIPRSIIYSSPYRYKHTSGKRDQRDQRPSITC